MNQASVTDLVRNFAGACRALVPNLDQARIPWTDGKQYDNWDRIAEALFESLVLEPCRFQAKISFPETPLMLTRYGFLQRSESAFLGFAAGVEAEGRFIRLLSVKEPFDYCEGMVNGHKAVHQIFRVSFSFVMIERDGSRREIESVALDL